MSFRGAAGEFFSRCVILEKIPPCFRQIFNKGGIFSRIWVDGILHISGLYRQKTDCEGYLDYSNFFVFEYFFIKISV